MERKVILSITILIALLAIPMALAATSMISPSTKTNHTGTVNIVMTYVNGTDVTIALAANSTCYHNATGTWAAFSDTITVNEATTAGSNISMTGTITAALDDLDVGINCSVGNETEIAGSTVVIVSFDSTNPIITPEIDEDSISVGGLFHYSVTMSDATTGVYTKSCNITDPESTITSATTTASDLLFQTGRLIDEGTWTLSCTIADYAGNTASASATTRSSSMSAPYKKDSEVSGFFGNLDKTTLIVILIVVGLLIYIVGKKK